MMDDDYNPHDDFARSIDECYREIRERKAAGGPGWPQQLIEAGPFAGLKQNFYSVVLADPPWPFATWSHKGQGRSGEAHYQTMSHKELCALPVKELAAPDSVLLIWIVQTQIPQALKVVSAWGFSLKSVAFIWKKGSGLPLFPDDVVHQMGMGKWTRAEFEQCWLATKGNPKRQHADVRQVLTEKRREHSRKPDGIHERIERLVGGPYIELFARQRRLGWDAWGNEVGKFRGDSDGK
jgi:N6-adenosine-specific RNA methylase IME4